MSEEPRGQRAGAARKTLAADAGDNRRHDAV